jgi:hypothetical protein
MKGKKENGELTADLSLPGGYGDYGLTVPTAMWRIVLAKTFQDRIYFLWRFVKDEMRPLSPPTRMHLVRSQRLMSLHPELGWAYSSAGCYSQMSLAKPSPLKYGQGRRICYETGWACPREKWRVKQEMMRFHKGMRKFTLFFLFFFPRFKQ